LEKTSQENILAHSFLNMSIHCGILCSISRHSTRAFKCMGRTFQRKISYRNTKNKT